MGWVAKFTPYALSLLRIVVGLMFMQHGAQKLFGAFGAPSGPVPLNSQMGLAGILELYGGGLFMFGALTRPVAFLLCGEMAVAYFQGHAPRGFPPIVNKGELAVLYCFTFLYFACAGGGPVSVDTLVANIKPRTPQPNPPPDSGTG